MLLSNKRTNVRLTEDNMTAWDVLLKCGICELPVDLQKVCKGLGIGLFSYSQGYRIIQKFGLVQYAIGADGFLFQIDDFAIAFYNQQQSKGRRNFTIAHEIGHFALGHANTDGAVRREPGSKNDSDEIEANSFAARLTGAVSPYFLRYFGLSACPVLRCFSLVSTAFRWRNAKIIPCADYTTVR